MTHAHQSDLPRAAEDEDTNDCFLAKQQELLRMFARWSRLLLYPFLKLDLAIDISAGTPARYQPTRSLHGLEKQSHVRHGRPRDVVITRWLA